MSQSSLGDKSGKKPPRMPASSLRICGQPWLLGAEDLCFPATLALIWDVVMFGVALSAKLLDDSHGMPPTCSSDLDHQLYLALLLQVIVWSCITLCDISMLTSALRTKMFTRNYTIVKIVYTRLLLTLADFIITLLTAIWLSSAVRTQCLNLDETTRVVDDLSLTIIAGGFMHVLAASIFICISFAMGGPTSQRTWRKRLSCIFCCCFSQDSNADGEQDVIGSIARIFTEFFHVEGQHVVPSDIIVGFALVEGAQRKRQKAGERFLFAEPPNRWETVSEEKKTTSGSVQLQDKPVDSKQIDVKIDTPGSNPHEPADTCLAGRQPSLMRQDWLRIADAKHYAKYSIGAYGWMMYAFENISCVFKCSVCDCGCGAPLPQQHDGSGCCGGHCCHWDINSFLKTSGIPKQDLLYCHLVSKVGSPVYWVCVDREKKSLVVAIRGTLSVADAITDMNARATPMDEYGYPGSYTHLGILNNAKALRTHLKEKGIVSKFLQANPDYDLVIVGHSLGAGTTGLLTIIMKDDFPGTKLKAFCLAPPLLLDPVLATSAWVRETITTIVYDYDIISHMSLGNLFKLKLQMGKLFEIAADSKWKILRAQWNQRYSGMFEPGNHDFKVVKATDSTSPRGGQSGNNEATERLLQEEAAAQQALISKQPSSGDVKSDNVKAVEVHDFQMDLRPQYLPGRIYHVIPEHRIRDKQPCCACCCGPKRRTFIYPAAQETFQEVVISSQMFKNHLPPAYALNFIDIPDLEVCRKG